MEQQDHSRLSAVVALVFCVSVLIGCVAALLRPQGQMDAPRQLRTVPYVGMDMVEEAYENADAFKQRGGGRADVVFVPHHLLAKDLIAQTLQTQATKRRRTVVLLSPNHFSSGSAPVLFSTHDWKTSVGVAETDRELTELLVAKTPLSAVDETPFAKEHGVYGIIPFIESSLPDARLVTVMVKDALRPADARAIAAALDEVLPDDALLVASFDFAHEQTDLAATLHDKTALAVLSHQDLDGAWAVNIDSRPGLSIAMEYARLREAQEFRLFANKNSVDYTGDSAQTDVTSYIAGAYMRGDQASMRRATVLAFGDLMLNRDLRPQLLMHGNSWPFEPMRRFLSGTDLTVANLEGTITSFEPRREEPERILFTFDPSVAPTLSILGFDAFSLANNHSRDFGTEGLVQTKRYLDAAGMASFGDLLNREDLSYVADIRGQRIGFVGVHTVYGRDAGGVMDEIRWLRPDVDALIVMAHWGDEYETRFNTAQQSLAHELIDAGADIILGSHPHVVQPFEFYKGKPIFYSMGNFVFDQQFSAEVRRGLAVGFDVQPDRFDVYLFPHSISPQFQVGLFHPNQSAVFYKEFAEKAVAPDEVKTDMSDGIFTLLRP